MQFYPQESGSLWSPAAHYRPPPQQMPPFPQYYGAYGNMPDPQAVGAGGAGSIISGMHHPPASPSYACNNNHHQQQVPNFITDDSNHMAMMMGGGTGSTGNNNVVPPLYANALHNRRESMMIDKFRLLKMIRTTEPDRGGSGTEAEEYFRTIENQSHAQIASWPSTVDQVEAQTKMRPEVAIELRGTAQAIEVAKTIISQELDAKMHRVTLHMYVTFAEHSHIIGKGGNNVRTISEDTKCHIHFPDCNRNAKPQDKSNLVTISGGLPGVEIARQRVRSLLPLNFMFDVPLHNQVLAGENEIRAHLESAQKQFRITANLQRNERTHGQYILVRGPQDERTLKGVHKVMTFFTRDGKLDAKQIPVRTSLEVLPNHQLSMRDPTTLGKYIQTACHTFNTFVKFPIDDAVAGGGGMTAAMMDQPAFMTPSTVLIYGLPEACYGTWMFMQSLLPIKVAFDVKTTQDFDPSLVNHVRDRLQVDVQFRTKYHNKCRTITSPQTVSMGTIEHNISKVYDARCLLLKLEDCEVSPESIPQKSMHLDFDLALLRDDMTVNSTLHSFPISNGDCMKVEKLPDSQLLLTTNYNPIDKDNLASQYETAVDAATTTADCIDAATTYENTFQYNGGGGMPQQQQAYRAAQHNNMPYNNNAMMTNGYNKIDEAFSHLRVANDYQNNNMPFLRSMPPTAMDNEFPYSMHQQKQQQKQSDMFLYQKLPTFAGAVVSSGSSNGNLVHHYDTASDAGTPTLDAVKNQMAMVNNASSIASSGTASDDSSGTFVPGGRKPQRDQSPLFIAQNNNSIARARSSFCQQQQQQADGNATNRNNMPPSTANSSGSNSFYTNSSGVSSSSAGAGNAIQTFGGDVFSDESDVSRLTNDTDNISGNGGQYDLSFAGGGGGAANFPTNYDVAGMTEQCPASPEILSPQQLYGSNPQQRMRQQQHQQQQQRFAQEQERPHAGERRASSSLMTAAAKVAPWNGVGQNRMQNASGPAAGGQQYQHQDKQHQYSGQVSNNNVWSDSSFFGDSVDDRSNEAFSNMPQNRSSLVLPTLNNKVNSGAAILQKRRSISSFSPLVLSPGAVAFADQTTPTMANVSGYVGTALLPNARINPAQQVAAVNTAVQHAEMVAENNPYTGEGNIPLPVITSDSKDSDSIKAALGLVGMIHYAQLFIDQEFSFETLLGVSDSDLKELKITNFGARRRILALPKDARQRLLRGQGFSKTSSAGSSPLTSPTAPASFSYGQAVGPDLLTSRPPSNMSNTSSSSGGSELASAALLHQRRAAAGLERVNSMTLTRQQSLQHGPSQNIYRSINLPMNNIMLPLGGAAAAAGKAVLGVPSSARIATMERINRLGTEFDAAGSEASYAGEVFPNDFNRNLIAKRRQSDGACMTGNVGRGIAGVGNPMTNRAVYPPQYNNNANNICSNYPPNTVATSGAAYSPNQWAETQQFEYENDAGNVTAAVKANISPPYLAVMQQQLAQQQQHERGEVAEGLLLSGSADAVVVVNMPTPTNRSAFYADSVDADDERSSSGGLNERGTSSSRGSSVAQQMTSDSGVEGAGIESVCKDNGNSNDVDAKKSTGAEQFLTL